MSLIVVGCASGAQAEEGLVLYGAGSLREVMTEIASTFAQSHGTAVRTEFGASGRMRERIEAGDKVDVFASADLGHPRKLLADGRATAMAMFARNSLCVLVPSRVGAMTGDVLVAGLLRPDLKIGVSPAGIDPLGDYTVELMAAIDRISPGARQALEARSVVMDNPPGSPPARSGDYVLDALSDGRVDLAVVYCSGRARYEKLGADAVMVPLPSELQIGPQYGLAVMRDASPDAALLALAILSPEGQAALARHGFKPLVLPEGR